MTGFVFRWKVYQSNSMENIFRFFIQVEMGYFRIFMNEFFFYLLEDKSIFTSDIYNDRQTSQCSSKIDSDMKLMDRN